MIHTLIVLSALAGGLQVLAPDHWLPASVLAWQQGWKSGKLFFFSVLIYLGHLIAGLALYFAFSGLLERLESGHIVLFALVLVVGSMAFRAERFQKISQVLRSGRDGKWGIYIVISLLGPCETVVPILVKGARLGAPVWLTMGAFSAGTLVVGTFVSVLGSTLWDRPLALPQSLRWAQARISVVPVVAAVVVGFGFLLKLV
ncbi:MAG: hypothetical protein ACXVCH_08115 [Bdellovibrionota bacterium]